MKVLDIKKLVERLGKTSNPFDPVLQRFLSPDRDKLEEELRLTERAATTGKANTPNSGAKKKDALALEIDTYLTAMVRLAKKELEDHLHGLAEIGIHQSNISQANNIRAATRAALNSLREVCRNAVNSLFSQRKRVTDGERALENFRRKNGLDRPAVFPENPNRIYGIVFFLFTLEIALNAYTLGSAHPEGPIGVVLETFMIAALNIAIGFTAGFYFWREIHHRNAFRMILGLVATVSLLAIIIGFNLGVGHFRDAILSLSARAQDLGVVGFIRGIAMLGEAVKESLLTHPIDLYDFKSYLTIFVGIGLALYAAKEGFSADDRYPGYGRISKEQDARVEEYSDLFARFQNELIEITKTAAKKINDSGLMAESAGAARKSHVGTATRLISAFEDWTEEINSLGAALYAGYRETNEEHRTEPLPPCFDIGFSLPPSLLKAPGYSDSDSHEPETDFSKLIKQSSIKVNNALNKYLGVYKTIGELAPDDLSRERASSFDLEVEKIFSEISEDLHDEGFADA